MVITFCGHHDIISSNDIKEKLLSVLKQTIDTAPADTVFTFYCGGYGSFDGLAANTVDKLKELYPDRKIENIYITLYIGPGHEERNKFMSEHYDEIIYPPLETVPKKFAISKRNEWMVDNADVVISYVDHGWGGAATTIDYARRKKKKIISLVEI